MSALSLAEAKTHLNITSSASDAELQVMIDRAEAAIGRLVGPLEPTTRTVRLSTSSALVLPGPVISVTSVTPTSPGAGSVSLTGIDVDTGAGVVSFPGTLSGAYVVVYQAGWQVVPEDLLLAVLELVRHFWGGQRGGVMRPGSTPPSPSAPFAMPYFVTTLLEPFMQAGVA